MVTLTFPHRRADILSSLVEKFRSSLSGWRQTRGYKALKESSGYVGHIRALEVTHGANGWHPHSHELWFVKSKLSDEQLFDLQARLFRLWKKAAIKSGFSAPSAEHGLKVTRAETAASYLVKTGVEQTWGMSQELTKSHIKKGRASSRTPWSILSTSDSSPADAALFVEFSKAFYGSRQLSWSRGLKAAFCIEELSDEEIAARYEQGSTNITSISAIDWRLILSQPRDVRGLVLRLAEVGGAEAVTTYLVGLRLNS